MGRIVVVTAVRAETRAVLAAMQTPRRRRGESVPRWEGRGGTHDVAVLEAGVGPAAAARALEIAAVDCDLLVSVGFAGALVSSLAPGDLVVPRRVVWENGSGTRCLYDVPAALHAAISAATAHALRAEAVGTLFSSPVIVATPVAKRALAERHDAVAVEMEAGALATWALARDRPLLVVRAILDGVDLSLETLPADIGTSWSARAGVVVTPSTWPLLLALRRHVGAAARTLRAAAAAVFSAWAPSGA